MSNDDYDRTVWKYDVPILGEKQVDIPGRMPRPVGVGIGPTTPDGHVSAWFMVSPKSRIKSRITLRVIGTGHDIPPGAGVIGGGVVDRTGPYIWHVIAIAGEAS